MHLGSPLLHFLTRFHTEECRLELKEKKNRKVCSVLRCCGGAGKEQCIMLIYNLINIRNFGVGGGDAVGATSTLKMLISNKKMLLSCLSVALVCTAMYPRVAQAAALRRCDVFLPGALGPPKLRVPLRLRGGVAAPVAVRKTNSTFDNSSLSTQASKLITEHKDKSDDIFSVYQKGKVLGEGGFAKVYKGKHRITGKEVAIKTIELCKIPADKLDMLQYEIEVMKMLDHPNIVRLYETFHDEDNHVMHLVMELCEGGDLLDFVLKTEIQENGSRGSTLFRFSCFFNIKNSFPSSLLSFTSFMAVMSSTYLLYAVRKISHEEPIDIPVTCLQMVMSPFSPIVLQAPKSGATQSLAAQPRCSSQSTSSRNSRRRCLARFCTFTPWTSHTETSNLKTSCLRSLSLYIYVGARGGADGSPFEAEISK